MNSPLLSQFQWPCSSSRKVKLRGWGRKLLKHAQTHIHTNTHTQSCIANCYLSTHVVGLAAAVHCHRNQHRHPAGGSGEGGDLRSPRIHAGQSLLHLQQLVAGQHDPEGKPTPHRHFQLPQPPWMLFCIIGRSCHKYHFCRNKGFVAASILLSQQKWYLWQLPPVIVLMVFAELGYWEGAEGVHGAGMFLSCCRVRSWRSMWVRNMYPGCHST